MSLIMPYIFYQAFYLLTFITSINHVMSITIYDIVIYCSPYNAHIVGEHKNKI